jgi:HTH DNA binding domain
MIAQKLEISPQAAQILAAELGSSLREITGRQALPRLDHRLAATEGVQNKEIGLLGCESQERYRQYCATTTFAC